MNRDDEELVNREVEGENTADESAGLAARLAHDPELRALHEGLARVVRTLERVKDVEPPPGLSRDVLREIGDGGTRVAWRGLRTSVFSRAPGLRPALTFASGLAAGLLVAGLLGPSLWLPHMDRSTLVGTMLPSRRLGRLEPVDRQAFKLEGARGDLTTQRGTGVVVAEIRVDAATAPELAIDFEGPALSPLAFEQSEGAGADIALGSDRVRLTHVGTGRYSVVLGVRGGIPSRLHLRLSAKHTTLEKILETGAENANFSDR
jgi:anti-sigma factor RsiW